MKKKAGVRFEFAGDFHSSFNPDSKGRIKCDFCGEWYKASGVCVVLYEFTICPSCIQTGPHAIAAEADRMSKDKARIARQWGEKAPDFSESMAQEYHKLHQALQGIRSFGELTGGKVALGVAGALKRKDRGRKGRAA